MATRSSESAGRTLSSTTQAQDILGGNEDTSDDMTPLEHDLLEEYEKLADNMKKTTTAFDRDEVILALELKNYLKNDEMLRVLAGLLDTLAGSPTAEILRGLELLERKTSLVFTLLKASVYSIVLQQEIYSGDQAGGNGTGSGGLDG